MLPYASWEQYKNSKFKNMISFHSTNDLLSEIKNGKEVKKVININLDMDGRIPINVWTGDSIARSGKGKILS